MYNLKVYNLNKSGLSEIIVKPPGPKSIDWIERNKASIAAQTASRFLYRGIVVSKAEGVYVSDLDRNVYIDFSMLRVNSGHNNKKIISMIKQQIDCGGFEATIAPKVTFEEKLKEITPGKLVDGIVGTCRGGVSSILITLILYQQPIRNLEITHSDFQLVNTEGKNLGWVFSTMSLRYIPEKNFGRFYINIETKVSEPIWQQSIFSKNIIYRVSFWWKGKLIESVESNYFGSLNRESGRIMNSGISLPSIQRPMDIIRLTFGNIFLKVEGTFFNKTTNQIISENKIDFHLLKIHPNLKLFTLFTLVALFGMAIFENSGPIYQIKNIWERKSRLEKTREQFLNFIKKMKNSSAR